MKNLIDLTDHFQNNRFPVVHSKETSLEVNFPSWSQGGDQNNGSDLLTEKVVTWDSLSFQITSYTF